MLPFITEFQLERNKYNNPKGQKHQLYRSFLRVHRWVVQESGTPHHPARSASKYGRCEPFIERKSRVKSSVKAVSQDKLKEKEIKQVGQTLSRISANNRLLVFTFMQVNSYVP